MSYFYTVTPMRKAARIEPLTPEETSEVHQQIDPLLKNLVKSILLELKRGAESLEGAEWVAYVKAAYETEAEFEATRDFKDPISVAAVEAKIRFKLQLALEAIEVVYPEPNSDDPKQALLHQAARKRFYHHLSRQLHPDKLPGLWKKCFPRDRDNVSERISLLTRLGLERVPQSLLSNEFQPNPINLRKALILSPTQHLNKIIREVIELIVHKCLRLFFLNMANGVEKEARSPVVEKIRELENKIKRLWLELERRIPGLNTLRTLDHGLQKYPKPLRWLFTVPAALITFALIVGFIALPIVVIALSSSAWLTWGMVIFYVFPLIPLGLTRALFSFVTGGRFDKTVRAYSEEEVQQDSEYWERHYEFTSGLSIADSAESDFNKKLLGFINAVLKEAYPDYFNQLSINQLFMMNKGIVEAAYREKYPDMGAEPLKREVLYQFLMSEYEQKNGQGSFDQALMAKFQDLGCQNTESLDAVQSEYIEKQKVTLLAGYIEATLKEDLTTLIRLAWRTYFQTFWRDPVKEFMGNGEDAKEGFPPKKKPLALLKIPGFFLLGLPFFLFTLAWGAVNYITGYVNIAVYGVAFYTKLLTHVILNLPRFIWNSPHHIKSAYQNRGAAKLWIQHHPKITFTLVFALVGITVAMILMGTGVGSPLVWLLQSAALKSVFTSLISFVQWGSMKVGLGSLISATSATAQASALLSQGAAAVMALPVVSQWLVAGATGLVMGLVAVLPVNLTVFIIQKCTQGSEKGGETDETSTSSTKAMLLLTDGVAGGPLLQQMDELSEEEEEALESADELEDTPHGAAAIWKNVFSTLAQSSGILGPRVDSEDASTLSESPPIPPPELDVEQEPSTDSKSGCTVQ